MSKVLPEQTSDRPARRIGPERFEEQLPDGGRPTGSRWSAALAALGLLGIVVGIPAALISLAGVPSLPTSLPDREVLSQALSVEQLVNVLVAVVWLAWLQFTLCLLVELVSALRGVGLPRSVPLSGPSQRLARSLIAAVLITAAVAGPAAASGPEPDTSSSARSTSVSASVSGQVHGASSATGVVAAQQAQAGADADAARLEAQLQRAAAPLSGRKVYTVKAPEGRYHDNLWDIAERHLGEGRRYKEIFTLNQGREQPDGRRLELSRLIQPDWKLVMPEDAVGVERVAEDRVERPVAPPTAGAVDVPAVDGVDGAQLLRDAGDPSAASDDGAGAVEQGGPGSMLAGGLAGGGLLAAGLLAALRRARRRPGPELLDEEALAAEIALRLGADLDRAALIDAALRSLARQCADEGMALPPVFAALASDDRIELLLAPEVRVAPQGWQVSDDGARWAAALEAGAAVEGPAPFPALVSVGRDAERRDVLIDLDAADGPVSLTGDASAAHGVAVAIATSLATSPWADGLQVAASGLPDAVHDLAPHRLHRVQDAAAGVAQVLARTPAADDVLTGRRAGGEPTHVLLLASDPGESALAPLTTSAGRRARGVLVTGELSGASWRLHVDEAGTIEVAPLGLRVTGYRLDDREMAVLGRLLQSARDTAPATATSGPSAALPVPAAAVDVDDAAFLAATSRVSLLGVPEARADGALDPSRIALATELVAYLAVHRDGVHPTVLGAAIWPRGVGADVRDATVARVRDWLGEDRAGSPLLRTLPDGRLQLSDGVPSDWDVLCTLVARARSASDPAREADLLRRALRLVRGPLLQGAPQGRYAWVVRTRLERTVPEAVVAVAHRMAELLHDEDPSGARTAAAAGLRLDPRAQVLWRDALVAAAGEDSTDPGGGPGGGSGRALPAAVHQMRALLSDLGEPLEAETEALVEELSPGMLARDA